MYRYYHVMCRKCGWHIFNMRKTDDTEEEEGHNKKGHWNHFFETTVPLEEKDNKEDL